MEMEWEWREVGGHHVDLTVIFATPGMAPGEEIILQPTAHLRAGAGRYCTCVGTIPPPHTQRPPVPRPQLVVAKLRALVADGGPADRARVRWC